MLTAHNGRRRCARAPFTQRVRRDFDGALVVQHVPDAITSKHEKEVVPHDWWQQTLCKKGTMASQMATDGFCNGQDRQ